MDLRERALAALPPGAFLRRDRGKALYVTNAPAFGGMEKVEGLRAETDGGLTHLFVEPRVIAECPYEADVLAKELSRFTGVSEETTEVFSDILKALEVPDETVYRALDRRVRQAAAQALRIGGGEGLYYCALALAQLKRILNI